MLHAAAIESEIPDYDMRLILWAGKRLLLLLYSWSLLHDWVLHFGALCLLCGLLKGYGKL